MAGKCCIGGTARKIVGGKAMVGGTVRTIAGGKTMVGGTVYDVSFQGSTGDTTTMIVNIELYYYYGEHTVTVDWLDGTVDSVSEAGMVHQVRHEVKVGDGFYLYVNTEATSVNFDVTDSNGIEWVKDDMYIIYCNVTSLSNPRVNVTVNIY